MRSFLVLFALGGLIGFSGLMLREGHTQAPPVAPPQMAKGVVFHDANGNRLRDAGEEPRPGVRVSNGNQIVVTNEQGEYMLPVDDDTALFVIKPRGWRTPLSEDNLPQFYYIHKPNGSADDGFKYKGVAPTGPLPASVDFPLYPQDEPKQFKALLFGDPQPRNQQEVDYITHDVVEALVGKTDASFGVTLGDIAFDNLETFEPLNRSIALLGIPWYNVIGNHDINYDARNRRNANETYERIYGPSYYSFDHGPVHVLVLDDIEWMLKDPATGKWGYRGGFGPEQLEFIKNDLAMIPEDQLVVLMMHIPLIQVNDRHGLYRLIEKRPFSLSISAHTHTMEHHYITDQDGWQGPKPHHHIINVTVCGSWWSGAPDERGIPHAMMSDGGPNGCSLISFDGQKYSLRFLPAGRDPNWQMKIDLPEELKTSKTAETPVYANVFEGSIHSTVEMRLNEMGEWKPMEHVGEVDPLFVRTAEHEAMLLDLKPNDWRKMPKPGICTHLWKLNLPSLPPGQHHIEVRTTDQFGQTDIGHRSVRVVAD